MLLAPLVLSIGFYLSYVGGSATPSARPPIPWFVFGFISVIGLNSMFDVPPATKAVLMTCTSFLLTIALAGMGLETRVSRIVQKGLRPFALALAATLFISGLSLLLVLTIGRG
jgi:uncharacterized membrane protein YadS